MCKAANRSAISSNETKLRSANSEFKNQKSPTIRLWFENWSKQMKSSPDIIPAAQIGHAVPAKVRGEEPGFGHTIRVKNRGVSAERCRHLQSKAQKEAETRFFSPWRSRSKFS